SSPPRSPGCWRTGGSIRPPSVICCGATPPGCWRDGRPPEPRRGRGGEPRGRALRDGGLGRAATRCGGLYAVSAKSRHCLADEVQQVVGVLLFLLQDVLQHPAR